MSTPTDRNGHVSKAVKLALMAGTLPWLHPNRHLRKRKKVRLNSKRSP